MLKEKTILEVSGYLKMNKERNLKKAIITIFTFLLCMPVFSFNCAQFEAQIVADAEIVFDRPDESCQAKINEIRHFSAHVFCPISFHHAENSFVYLTPTQCDHVREDNQLNGYLILKEGESIFSLED